MVNLDAFIQSEGIGYAHAFGDTVTIGKNDLKTLKKSKIEGKYVATIDIKGKEENVDYLTPRDLMALRDGKSIECTWTRSRSGKAYWNHSSSYVEEEEEK